MILPLLFPGVSEPKAIQPGSQSSDSQAIMNSPTTTNQSSGFHVLELHGGTVATGVQVLLALAIALIALRLAVRYRRKRRAAASIIREAANRDTELATKPSSEPSKRSEAEVREEFTAVVLPMIARDREHFNRIISNPPDSRRVKEPEDPWMNAPSQSGLQK
jgi:hypothetical protein